MTVLGSGWDQPPFLC